jgi:hypothetical protein
VSVNKPTEESQSTVTFSNGVIATATDSVILNIPQRPLMELLRNSTLPDGALDKRDFQGLHGVQGEIVAKLYLYYPKAWWYEVRTAPSIIALTFLARRTFKPPSTF